MLLGVRKYPDLYVVSSNKEQKREIPYVVIDNVGATVCDKFQVFSRASREYFSSRPIDAQNT